MNDPIASAASGAIHQKRRLRNTVATPRHCSRKLAPSGCAGVSGTTMKMSAAAANVAMARATKTPRQDMIVSAASTGEVASNAPVPPATIIQPDSDACLSGGYQVAIAFSGAIRHTATPAPIRPRASASPVSPSLAANASAPIPAIDQQHRLDAARAVAIEQDAGRNLQRAEREEVRAGEQPQR